MAEMRALFNHVAPLKSIDVALYLGDVILNKLPQ